MCLLSERMDRLSCAVMVPWPWSGPESSTACLPRMWIWVHTYVLMASCTGLSASHADSTVCRMSSWSILPANPYILFQTMLSKSTNTTTTTCTSCSHKKTQHHDSCMNSSDGCGHIVRHLLLTNPFSHTLFFCTRVSWDVITMKHRAHSHLPSSPSPTHTHTHCSRRQSPVIVPAGIMT